MHRRLLTGLLSGVCLAALSHAQTDELRVPSDAVAGSAASIATAGSESATFYLVGPGGSFKRDVKLGEDIKLRPQEVRTAGRYIAIVCAGSCQSASFFVNPATPVNLTFLVHPSRAPVGQSDIVSGVALPFDEFRNLVVAPVQLDFQLAAGGKTVMSHPASTDKGVAWFRANSGKSAGALQVLATMNDVTARRVVQQVASDPCSLHIKGQRSAKGIVVETEPVRDCAGNPVPDGTVVTFTGKDGKDTYTVDAPIKQGVARAQMTVAGPVVISAASGVVMGNELRMGAQ
jgi:hypothetical protein